jgi:hypothetical protein
MTQRKLSRIVIDVVKDQHVHERLDHKFDAIAQRPEIAAICWHHKNHAGKYTRLRTAYGKLEVRPTLGGWMISRDGTLLVHARSPRGAIFASQRAAKAAGLVHLNDGFGDAPPYKDGLWWDIRRLTPEHPAAQTTCDFAVDPTLSDDHEWGRQQLGRLLKKSNRKAAAADEKLISDIEAVARSWQLPPPPWTKRTHGCFALNTPYGILVVRRLIGWTVERNGTPLVWFISGEKVIFDKLEHAKTIALACVLTCSDGRISGVRWGKRADDQVARQCGDQPAAEGGSPHVVAK